MGMGRVKGCGGRGRAVGRGGGGGGENSREGKRLVRLLSGSPSPSSREGGRGDRRRWGGVVRKPPHTGGGVNRGGKWVSLGGSVPKHDRSGLLEIVGGKVFCSFKGRSLRRWLERMNDGGGKEKKFWKKGGPM